MLSVCNCLYLRCQWGPSDNTNQIVNFDKSDLHLHTIALCSPLVHEMSFGIQLECCQVTCQFAAWWLYNFV